MANINHLINNMPQVARKNGFVRKAPSGSNDQMSQIAINSIQSLFTLVQQMLAEQKDLTKGNGELFEDVTDQLKDLLSDLRKMVLSNDRQLIVHEIEKIAQTINDKIHDPNVNVDLHQDEVVKAVNSIKFPTPKDVDFRILKDEFRALASKLDTLNQSVSELEMISPDSVSISNIDKMKVSTNLDKEALALLKYLENLKTSAKNPLSVRLSDGKAYYKAMGKINDGIQAVAMSGGNETPSKTFVSGVKAMTGSTVQLTSTSVGIRWITLSAVQQPCAIGGSNATVDLSTPSNSMGDILYPGSPPYKMRISDPSLLYADGPSGAAIAYTYYS